MKYMFKLELHTSDVAETARTSQFAERRMLVIKAVLQLPL